MVKGNLAKNILELMDAKGITNIHQLSKESGIPQPTLHKLIKGITTDPRVSSLEPLAQFFKVSMDALMSSQTIDTNALFAGESFKHSVIEVPKLLWEQADRYNEVLSKVNQDNWDDWVALDDLASEITFALEVEDTDLPMPFVKGAIIIIDPEQDWKKHRGFVLLASKTEKLPVIKSIIREGADIWLASLNQGIPNEKFSQGAWTVIGKIIRSNVLLD